MSEGLLTVQNWSGSSQNWNHYPVPFVRKDECKLSRELKKKLDKKLQIRLNSELCAKFD